jgi:DNA-binding transcriptional LysR family regulator
MDFRHLAYFVAVAEELHFRRAAERLRVVQPALSQQIARLEAELGVLLLVRTKRQVQLTEAGRVLLVDARRLLAARERATERVRRAAGGESGRLDVGFVGPATYSVLPKVVRAFRSRYPDVVLNLHEHPTGGQLDLLAGHELDVGIVRLPTDDDRFEFEHLLTEPVVAALPAGHALAGGATGAGTGGATGDGTEDGAGGGAAVPLAGLAGESFVIVPRRREPVVFDRTVSLCTAAGFSPHLAHYADQVHALIGLVAAGLGVALVPESMRTLRRPDVVFRPLAPPVTGALDTGLAWRAGQLTPVAARFLATAREVVAPGGAVHRQS